MNAPSLEPTTAPPATAAAAAADPDDFFAASSHLRALRHLEQAIAQDDRLIVLTGDDGVGKTLVVQRLQRGFDPGAIWSVLLSAAHLPTGELAGSLAQAFGAAASGTSPALAALRRHLAAQSGARSVLAVIDDAHELRPQAVAELGELTREGTLRVLLCGRPALRTLLARQLPMQPASLSCHLEPLAETETPVYIEHRLRRIGWTGTPAFSAEAQSLIHRFSRGVPLRIDRLCERLLRAARRHTEPSIGADAVRRIARPRADEQDVPMLTSAVEPPSPSGWSASSDLAPDSGVPDWARDDARPPAAAPRAVSSASAAARRRRIVVVSGVAVLAALAAAWAWRTLEPLPVDASMTAPPPPERPAPARAPEPEPAAPPVATAPPLPARSATPPPPAPAPAPVEPPPRAAAPPAPPTATAPSPTPTPAPAPAPARSGTPVAAPPAVPGPCTATVAALGLCTSTETPP